MKRKSAWLVLYVFGLVAFFSVVNASADSRETGASWEEFNQYLSKQVPQWMDAYRIPGVVVSLVEGGKVLWEGAWGYADLAKRRPLTVDTRCRVESISKSVTAWGVMKLVQQGRLDLDAPIGKYVNRFRFPDSPFSAERVTIRRLLSHTAGLSLGTIGVRYAPDGPVPSLMEALKKDGYLVSEPGSGFSYSNTGFNLLELLIEEVTGQEFSRYMEKEILHPLGMRRSSYVFSPLWDPPVPKGYSASGNPIPVYVYPEKGAGGLFAPVGDIARFVCAEGGYTGGLQEKGFEGVNISPLNSSGGHSQETFIAPVLERKTRELLFEPQTPVPGLYGWAFPFYGFGHFIEYFSDGTKAVSHGGQGSGWMSHFHLLPSTGDGIVILTNSQRSWPLFAYLLRDWARWKGYSSPGMSRIILGEWILWGVVAGVLFLCGWKGLVFIREMIQKKRKLSLTLRHGGVPRMLAFTFSVLLLLFLGWARAQEYLFIRSVFPNTVQALGVSVSLSALLLLAYALFPRALPVGRKHDHA